MSQQTRVIAQLTTATQWDAGVAARAPFHDLVPLIQSGERKFSWENYRSQVQRAIEIARGTTQIMIYRNYGNSELKLSILGLGGHEFRDGGIVKGFDQGGLHAKGGIIFPGFGGAEREKLVARALDAGVNLFDLTLDSEKEAMGRILKNLKPAQEIVIQSRPDSLVYGYDEANRGLADYARLHEEVVKALRLLDRERIDILNFGFLQPALDADADYLNRIGENIAKLKAAGLIRFASADTFSGQSLYLKQIESCHFDSVFINYNLREMAVEEQVLPATARAGMGFIGREVWMKGQIFKMAEQAELRDFDEVARAAVKWNLRLSGVTAAVVGVSSVAQLNNALGALENLELSESESALVEKICETELWRDVAGVRRANFLGA